MNNLKIIGYLLVALGFGLKIPQTIENYKKEKNLENLLELCSTILIVPSAIILMIGYFLEK